MYQIVWASPFNLLRLSPESLNYLMFLQWFGILNPFSLTPANDQDASVVAAIRYKMIQSSFSCALPFKTPSLFIRLCLPKMPEAHSVNVNPQ